MSTAGFDLGWLLGAACLGACALLVALAVVLIAWKSIRAVW
jgi:hypothetical protein